LNKQLGSILTALFTLFSSLNAWSEDFRAQFISDPIGKINQLAWDESSETQNPSLQKPQSQKANIPNSYFVKLKGTFLKKNWYLLHNSHRIPISPKGEFAIEVPINSNRNEFELKAIGPLGKVEKTTGMILLSGWQKLKQTSSLQQNQQPTQKKLSFTPRLSMAYLNYQEPARSLNLNEIGIAPQINGRLNLIPRSLALEGSLFGLFPFYSTQSTATHLLYGGGIKLDYRLPIRLGQWETWVGGGAYFWKMLVSDQSFGIGFAGGPLVDLRFEWNQGTHPLFIYFRYGSFFNDTASLKLSNHEIAGGGGLKIGTLKRYPIDLTLTISRINFSLNEPLNQVSLLSTAVGLRLVF
jgi:hypothetical protein